MRNFFAALAIALFGAAATNPAHAEPATEPRVIGLKFYADWCGSCKAIDPKLEVLKKEFSGEPIVFALVDMTDDATKAHSQRYARWMGLEEVYATHAPKTGFMLLLDADSKEVLGRLNRTQDVDEMRANIVAALAR